MAQSFREVLRRYAPTIGENLMTYAQELLAEGEERGEIRTQVRLIEGFLRAGATWAMIEEATGVNGAQFQALQQQVEDMNE